MHARFVLIAAVLMSAHAFAAEPHKVPERSPAQPQPATPSLVLASAEAVQPTAAADQSAATPAKRPRIGRVTTCRCGDPQPSDSDGGQEQ
jgi:hypothetical protein